MKIGIVGYGYVGGALGSLFCKYDLVVCDPARGEHAPMSEVATCDVVFVCVPTPSLPTGECDTSIVDDVLDDLSSNGCEGVVVIKSTVPPGYTQGRRDDMGMRLVFSPEFLTAANAIRDLAETNRVIIGGASRDTRVVASLFEEVFPDQWISDLDRVKIIQTDSTTAEMVKLSANAHLTARVVLSNEIALVCEALGVNYADMCALSQLDPRIGKSHMAVPGPDGRRGAGGPCLPKDLLSLRHVARELGEDDTLLTALHQRNRAIRGTCECD